MRRAVAVAPAVLAALTVLAVGICLAAGPVRAEVRLSVRVAPERIGVGQSTLLEITAHGDGVADLEIDPRFALENLEIASGPHQSMRWNVVNGKASRSESLSWRLRPQAVGTARVHGIVVRVNDQTFEHPDQSLTVETEDVAQTDPFGRTRVPSPFEDLLFPRRRPRPGTAEPKLFLRAEVSPSRPYAGQQVLYTLYLFTQADIGSINPERVPDFEGFWVQDIPQPEPLKPEMVELQGATYGRVALLQKAVFPLRPGSFRLDPVEARILAKVPEYGWLGTFSSRGVELRRTSNAVNLEVRALPPVPPELDAFRGAVGRFEIEANLEPSSLEAGQATTLTVAVSGRGNLEGLKAPRLPELDGIRIFPPEQSGSTSISGTRVLGDKRWSYVLVPDRAGEWTLPALPHAYFDPWEGAYRSSRTRPLTLIARAAEVDSISTPAAGSPTGADPAVPTGASASGGPGARADAGPEGARWWLSPALWLGASLLAMIGFVAAGLTRRAGRRGARAATLRDEIRSLASESRSRRAAERMEAAWRSYLTDRYDLPRASGPETWPSALAGKIPRGAATELARFLEDLEQLRSAPELAASAALQAELTARALKLSKSL